LADRFLGSPEIYGHKEREAEQSVNYVTCHDGFTLNDLVSYDQKHNEPNGEDNRDGANDNRSWNCGVEGPCGDPAIENLRERQIKNLLTVTFLSLGMPMLLMGDEARRSQRGNNNAYCQDNEASWFDWNLVRQHGGLHRFVELLAARRALRKMGGEGQRRSLNQLLRGATKSWHGVRLHQPDWSQQSHSLAFSAELPEENLFFFIIFNAYWEPLEFQLPAEMHVAGQPWRRWIDTSLESPHDIQDWPAAKVVAAKSYRAGPRSVVVLIAAADTDAAKR
jgi:glycogen operon protein